MVARSLLPVVFSALKYNFGSRLTLFSFLSRTNTTGDVVSWRHFYSWKSFLFNNQTWSVMGPASVATQKKFCKEKCLFSKWKHRSKHGHVHQSKAAVEQVTAWVSGGKSKSETKVKPQRKKSSREQPCPLSDAVRWVFKLPWNGSNKDIPHQLQWDSGKLRER